MKQSITLVILLITIISIQAQTYVDIPWREGVIIKKGKEINGMIRLGGDLFAPYLNNEKVYFVENTKWIEGKRPKKKVTKEYKAKDLDGYTTYTEDKDGNRIDMSFKTYEIKVQGTFKKKKIKAFLKRDIQGTISVYSFVPKPAKKIIASSTEVENDRRFALNHSTNYLQIGNEKLQESAKCNLIELLSECPEVVDNIKNEKYGFKPLENRPKQKGLKKLLAGQKGDNELENNILKAITDYNSCVEN